ncbi:MAG: ABC transporter permease [Bacteroidetes bacterium]|nr:ABC transporter permease [Bacteroidota bacterium]
MFLRKKKYISSGSLSKLALRKLLKNNLAIGSMVIIIVAGIIAVLGYWITPDPTPFANEQFIELSAKKPGFTVNMLKVEKNEKPEKTNFLKRMFYGQKRTYTCVPFIRYRFDGQYIIISEFSDIPGEVAPERTFDMADVLYPLSIDDKIIRDGNQLVFKDVLGNMHRESLEEMKNKVLQERIIKRSFLLGTDRYGRDMLSELMIGTRVSLSVGFISVFISLLIGIVLGSLAGFFRGRVDSLIVWIINVVWSIPTLLLVIAITFALGKGFWQVFVAVGLTMWVEVARVVRGQIMSIREKEYVEAGRALGFRNLRIITRHILPNVMAPVIVITAANFASAILIEAGLSFLGIGVQPPIPSWGTMIKENYSYIILDSAYLAILPGIAIMITVLAFMLIGNALRDALDVKTSY